MMAKKKKGPGADALAQLEAYEEELDKGVAVIQEQSSIPLKKKGGKKKKGPAANALAAIEELEAGGEGDHVMTLTMMLGYLLQSWMSYH